VAHIVTNCNATIAALVQLWPATLKAALVKADSCQPFLFCQQGTIYSIEPHKP